jgi:alkyldihydroxyacetonephosphate synthase
VIAPGPARIALSLAGPGLRRDLAAIVGEAHVSNGEADRLAYSRDLWPKTILWAKEGLVPPPPLVVVWPGSAEEIAAVVRFAVSRKIAITPYGAGSGVCGGTVQVEPGIVLDVKRLDRVTRIDLSTREADAEAGINGEILEHHLDHAGATLGHFPSSIYCSTLGGWLAARSAGQCSSRYGKIEDLALGLTFVSGEGELVRTRANAAGPDLAQLLIGSEGTLGVITDATLRIAPRPQARHFGGWRLPDVDAGVEAMRRIFHAGLRPAVVRLYDEFDTLIGGGGRKGAEEPGEGHAGPSKKASRFMRAALRTALDHSKILNAFAAHAPGGCLLVVVGEGGEAEMAAEKEGVDAVLREAGGASLGEAPGKRWLSRRHAVSYRQSPLIEAGGFVDTMEVALRWSAVADLYRAVRAAVAPYAFVMAHFSHAYVDGASIYFSFAGTGKDPEDLLVRYDATWKAALDAVMKGGGTLSHHHGVGVSKAAWMPAEHGASMRLLRALKLSLDPHGIMNPGKLGL